MYVFEHNCVLTGLSSFILKTLNLYFSEFIFLAKRKNLAEKRGGLPREENY